MQVSFSMLILGSAQVLLLIWSVYLHAFQWVRDHVRIHIADAALLTAQLGNLVLLRRCILNLHGSQTPFVVAECIFLLLPLLRLLWLAHRAQAQGNNLCRPRSVREAIDTLPEGIGIATAEGQPILINKRLNELIYLLTGHTIMNTYTTWEELQQLNSSNGCRRLTMPRTTAEVLTDAADKHLIFLFPNGSIWRFQWMTLKETLPHYLQLEATDITQLYRYSETLYENNKRLTEQYDRQQTLLANIVKINHEKELLAMKMRIHDELGQSILTTKQRLEHHTIAAHLPDLADMWSSTIRKLSDSKQSDIQPEASPELELQSVAHMIGCRIVFHGDRPAHRKTALLFYALVREALNNAVRHARADTLTVSIRPTGAGYHVKITDNGVLPAPRLTEGNGLSNLRRRLEQEGATLEIKCEHGVALIAQLPISRHF